MRRVLNVSSVSSRMDCPHILKHFLLLQRGLFEGRQVEPLLFQRPASRGTVAASAMHIPEFLIN